MAARVSRGLGTFGGVFTPSVLTILGIILFRAARLRGGQRRTRAGATHARPRDRHLGDHQPLVVGDRDQPKGQRGRRLLPHLTQPRGGVRRSSRADPLRGAGDLGGVLLHRVRRSGRVADRWKRRRRSVWRPRRPPSSCSGWRMPGADLATRFQFVIMIHPVRGAGVVLRRQREPLGPGPGCDRLDTGGGSPTGAFWVIFAIFFPAVTGFTQGVSMSGDLKEPARSLPLGTFLAIGLSTVVYVAGDDRPRGLGDARRPRG